MRSEPDLAGVDVLITDSNGASQTVTTDAGGNYIATVPPGATITNIDETDSQYPAGYAQTEGTDPTTTTAVAGANTFTENDGFYQSAQINGHLYVDTNGNGSQDAGEPDLAGVFREIEMPLMPVLSRIERTGTLIDGGLLAEQSKALAERMETLRAKAHELADGEFNLVHDVAVDSQDFVYVADRGNKRLQVFDADGKFLDLWDGFGTPWALCYDAQNKAIWVVDGDADSDGRLDVGETWVYAGSYTLTQDDLDGFMRGLARAGESRFLWPERIRPLLRRGLAARDRRAWPLLRRG